MSAFAAHSWSSGSSSSSILKSLSISSIANELDSLPVWFPLKANILKPWSGVASSESIPVKLYSFQSVVLTGGLLICLKFFEDFLTEIHNRRAKKVT